MRSLLRLVAALAVMMVFTLSASAQLTRGYISGTVSDPRGASIANIKVTATNRATNLARPTVTNEYGVYRLAAIEPGVYDLEFSGSDFQTARIEGIEVSSTQEVVVNTRLSVAAPTFTAEVLATPAGVDLAKASATIERRLGPDMLEKLPLTGIRDITFLMALAPTVVRVPPGAETPYVAAGQRLGMTEYLADGVDNRSQLNDFGYWRPLPEQIAEFQVKANAYSAEFGRTSGVVVSLISHSGSNQFHGSVWDYYSANWMAARTLANKQAGLGSPRAQEHHVGGSAGGPLRRDRTFFFGLIQAKPLSLGPSASLSPLVTIPTPAGYEALKGAPLGLGQTPESRQAVLGALGFLEEAHGLLKRWDSFSTSLVNGMPIQMGSTRIAAPNQANLWTLQGRIDHRLTDRDNLTVRYWGEKARADLALSGRANASNTSFGPLFAAGDDISNWSLAASHTRTLGPLAINELRFNYYRNSLDVEPNRPPGTNTSVGGLFNMGSFAFVPYTPRTKDFQWQDVMTFQRGRHSLKAGVDILHSTRLQVFDGTRRGSWYFPSLDEFMNNHPAQLSYGRRQFRLDIRQTQQAYFFQDDFRIKPNLTLNLGIRYQTAGVPLDGLGGATTPELLIAGVPPPVQRDTNDWAPRFGFAWSPAFESGLLARIFGDGRTVFRGGFGIAYRQNYGPANSLRIYPQSIPFRVDAPETFNSYPNLPAGGDAVPTFDPGYDLFNASPDAKNSTTHFYSFSMQRQFGLNHFLELGYIGNRAYHLWRSNERNAAVLTSDQSQAVINGGTIPSVPERRLNPTWGPRGIMEFNGYSNYNAALVQFDRRMARGLLVGLNYTFSATLDDGPGLPQNAYDYQSEYGRAAIDRPHRLAVHYNWEAPRLSAAPAILRHSLGGWEIAGYTEWQSGQPFTITTGVDSNGDGSVIPHPDRPNYNSSGALRLDPITNDWRTFSTPLDGTGLFVTPLNAAGGPLPNSMPFGGNLGRNTFSGPAYANTNLALLKQFVVTERTTIELRASWTNFFNHRNFGPPVAAMNSPNFGTNQSKPDARVTILGLKIRF